MTKGHRLLKSARLPVPPSVLVELDCDGIIISNSGNSINCGMKKKDSWRILD